MNHKKVGQLIAIKRKEMNMTQKQLADKLAVSNKAVSKWETGDGYPDITIVPTLADVLGLTTDELLSGKKSDRIESYNSIDNFSFKRDEIWINETILNFKNSCIISFAFAILGIIVYWVLWYEFQNMFSLLASFILGLISCVISIISYNVLTSEIKKHNGLYPNKSKNLIDIRKYLKNSVYILMICVFNFIDFTIVKFRGNQFELARCFIEGLAYGCICICLYNNLRKTVARI